MTRERIFVKDLLGQPHQRIEAVIHLRRYGAQEHADLGEFDHDWGAFQGRKEPTTRTTATSTPRLTSAGKRTTPPLGNSISMRDFFNEMGRNSASVEPFRPRSAASACGVAGMPLSSRRFQRK